LLKNALTIDLEDWYQGLTSTSQQIDRWPSYEDRVVDSTLKIIDILAEAGVKGTFFILGYVADQFPALMRQVADAGHEIGLHGYYHRQVFRLTPATFREEMIRGRRAVEEATGKTVYGHRAPMFSINKSALWALEVLQELGFLYDSSVFPTKNMLYGYPDAPQTPYFPFPERNFMEFPMSIVEYMGMKWPVSGGFYMRLAPYALYRQAIRRLHAQGKNLIFYLHPWEIDPEHPRSPLRLATLRERFTHYWGLNAVDRKLRALVRDFSFVPMRDLYQTYQKQAVPAD